jgi:SAM-dependent methyltransferase
MSRKYKPEAQYLGGYSPNDGTIEFYGRIKAFARPEHTVLDLGAGRAAWYEDDLCEYRKQTQLLKGFVNEVIADIDEAVLENRSSDRNILITQTVPLPDSSVDIIIADYVLEHIQNPEEFVSEAHRILRPKGIFCARTPHKYSYVAIGARMVPNRRHSDYLKNLQPERKSQDVFPTAYKLNTLSSLERNFKGFNNFSYIFQADPAYYFGNKYAYSVLVIIHKFSPSWFSGNIFAFLMKN